MMILIIYVIGVFLMLGFLTENYQVKWSDAIKAIVWPVMILMALGHLMGQKFK